MHYSTFWQIVMSCNSPSLMYHYRAKAANISIFSTIFLVIIKRGKVRRIDVLLENNISNSLKSSHSKPFKLLVTLSISGSIWQSTRRSDKQDGFKSFMTKDGCVSFLSIRAREHSRDHGPAQLHLGWSLRSNFRGR